MGCAASAQSHQEVGQPSNVFPDPGFGGPTLPAKLAASNIGTKDDTVSQPVRMGSDSPLVNVIKANEPGKQQGIESAEAMSALTGGAWGPSLEVKKIEDAKTSFSSDSSLNASNDTTTRILALAKGTALSEDDRAHFGVSGLLPPVVQSIDRQAALVLKQLRACHSQLDRYTLLSDLQHDNQTLFFYVVSQNVTESMPIIYTPTVGEACQKFGHIMKRPAGLYLSIKDKGNVSKILRNWPNPEVKVVCMTDGERILGLGDLGTYGMGIPIGKLNLYTVAGGIAPDCCLPLTIDVGTENEILLKDDFYTGLRRNRVRDPSYDEFIDEIMTCLVERWPEVLIQFEDFGNRNAFRLLEKYKDKYLTFNDDIQGTASVALAGYFSALRVKEASLVDEVILFQGAGEAGCGIADLLVVILPIQIKSLPLFIHPRLTDGYDLPQSEMVDQGLSLEKARSRIFLVDSQGLVTTSRDALPGHKSKYAKASPILKPGVSLCEIIKEIQPTAILGVSAQPGAFNTDVLQTMASLNQQPIIFALSNPTHKAECTAEAAIEATEGRALFCSGSPFDSFVWRDRVFVPGQGNNTYVFPGLGLGCLAAGATKIDDQMFRVASRTISQMVSDADLDKGCLFPPMQDIRGVSLAVAVACAKHAWSTKVANKPWPSDVEAYVESLMYSPQYPNLPRG